MSHWPGRHARSAVTLSDKVGEAPVGRLWHAVPCFPSISEVWLRLLEGYERVVTDDRSDDVRRRRGAEAGP